MNHKNTLVIDIDDTLLICDRIDGSYCNAQPIDIEINKLKELSSKYKIILHTGRHWNHYDITISQLRQFEIPFDQLIMGKPLGIYIDKDAKTSLADIE